MATATFELNVSEDVITRYGLAALQEKMQRRMDWEDLRLQALKIKAFLDEHGLDYDTISEEARQQAWDKYKYKIKDKLPPEAFE